MFCLLFLALLLLALGFCKNFCFGPFWGVSVWWLGKCRVREVSGQRELYVEKRNSRFDCVVGYLASKVRFFYFWEVNSRKCEI